MVSGLDHECNFLRFFESDLDQEWRISWTVKAKSAFCRTDGDAQAPVVKGMSDTRWSARADATKAHLHSFTAIKKVREDIFNNSIQKVLCRQSTG